MASFHHQVVLAVARSVESDTLRYEVVNSGTRLVDHHPDDFLVADATTRRQGVEHMALQCLQIGRVENSRNATLRPVGRGVGKSPLGHQCDLQPCPGTFERNKESGDTGANDGDIGHQTHSGAVAPPRLH